MRKRWMYNMSHEVATLGQVGKLLPFLREEVAPGDTWSGSINALVRLSPLKHALSQSAYVDFFVFYVPHRLVWADWEDFIAEGPVDSPTYSIPTNTVAAGSSSRHCLFQHNNGVSSTDYSAFPLYAYNLIWNEYFRDVNDAVLSSSTAPGAYGQAVNFKKDYWTVINDSLGFDQDEQFFDTNVGSGTQASAQDVLDAIARQKIQLKRATYGSRYIDILRSYGINVNYQMLQRPEVVAIGRSSIQATDVVATDGANLGELAGHGISSKPVRIKRKTFPEHGQLFGVMVLRFPQVERTLCDWMDRARTYDSFFDPGLVTLPPVEVTQEDVQPAVDSGVRSTSVGYIPWGNWYRSALNRCHSDMQTLNWINPAGLSYSSAASAATYRNDPIVGSIFSDTSSQHYQVWCRNRLRALRLIPKANISTTSQVNSLG